MINKSSVQAIILAAGRSTRFKIGQTKLSFLICGQEMILYPVKLFQKLNIPVCLVVGYQKEVVKAIIERSGIATTFVEQTEQKGTAHAVACSRQHWFADEIIIMAGDSPLVSEDVIQELLETHYKTRATITFISAHNSDPSLRGYGRIVKRGSSICIIEKSDPRYDDLDNQCCINSGIYIVKRSFLETYLDQIKPDPETKELYLTEIIHQACCAGLKVEMIHVPFDVIRGVNTLKELWTVEHIKRSELISYWMSQGVRFSTAQHVHIDVDVTLGVGTFIGTGVVLLQGTNIGAHCTIDAGSVIGNTTIGDHTNILPHSVIYDSVIGSNCNVGPMAHIRKGSVVGDHSYIGNFVEVSASKIGAYTKAKHLSYLGNANVGSHVNIGAGTITCNYDGVKKHETCILDGAFIGSNNALIAPVTIGKESLTAAGSTITENVPDFALAIARGQQVNKEQGATRIRERLMQQKSQESVVNTVTAKTVIPSDHP